MTYRRIKKSDYPQIKRLCEKHGVQYDLSIVPLLGFVAVTESDEVVGFIFAHAVSMIEPFISENPTVAVKLHSRMEGALSALNMKTIIAHIRKNDEKLQVELLRSGYTTIAHDRKLYKKTEE